MTSTSTAGQTAFLPVSYWQQAWKAGATRWHQAKVNPALLNHLTIFDPLKNKLIQQSITPRILVPLCGASLDIVYLFQQGYHVVGIDAEPLALRKAFEDASLMYEEIKHEELKEKQSEVVHYRLVHNASSSFSASSPSIDLFGCDLFSPLLTSELIGGKAHFAYDRGSFHAVGINQRHDYVAKILTLLKPLKEVSIDSSDNSTPVINYILSTPEYDEKAGFKGPPFSVTKEQLEEAYYPYKATLLDRTDSLKTRQSQCAELTFFDVCVYSMSI